MTMENDSYNSTFIPRSYDVYNVNQWKVAIKTLLIATTTLLILFGNSFCLVVLKNTTNMSDITRQFMYSLSAADLLIGIIIALPATLASPFGYWPLGKAVCFINSLIGGTVGYITAWSLVALSTERYIAIVYPLRYPSLVTLTGTRITLAIIWIAALFYEILVGFTYNFDVFYDIPTYMCWFLSTNDSHWLSYISFTLYLTAPLILIIFLYGRMFHIAKQHLSRIQAEDASVNRPFGKSAKKESKAATTFAIITISYGICAAPGICLPLYESFTGKDGPVYISFLTFIAVYGNSWVNVLVYYWRTKPFRKTAKDMIAKLLGVKTFQETEVTSSSVG